MLKKYIILGYIEGIGGWQVYENLKVGYLQKNGWDVSVLSYPSLEYDSEKVILDNLIPYKNNIFIELKFPISSLTKKQINNVLERIDNTLNIYSNKYDEIVIETGALYLVTWGEFLAQRYKSKHFLFLLHSYYNMQSPEMFKFLDFKYNRGELAVHYQNSMKELFQPYKEFPISDHCVLSASITHTLGEDSIDYAKILKKDCYDYVIGSIGWLVKEYIPSMSKDVISFAKKHPDKKFLFIVIGSSSGEVVEKELLKIAEGVKNLELRLMGAMFPIPRALVKCMDICIGSFSSARIADQEGVKTILMVDDSITPLGIMGYTLTKWPYDVCRDYKGSVYDLLEDIIDKKICEKLQYIPPVIDDDVDSLFEKHIQKLNESCNKKEYYNVLPLNKKNITKSILYRLETSLSKVIGIRNTLYPLTIRASFKQQLNKIRK
ncbi:MAG: hypothetical protein DBX47_07000 [Clostridiales bacterium]|nr:MAG: hypothetical protein DBX47_07000 [Clostridiales bacterium]